MATFIKATTEELAEANAKLEEANRRLSEMAVTDAMTGLGNKAAYFDRTRRLDEAIPTRACAFSAAVFDLNGLKQINDSFGHETGDRAIRDAARVLETVFGRENLYRIGGDEFIAVMEGEDDAQMQRLFDRLDEALVRENTTEKAYRTPLSMSKGFAAFDPQRDAEYRDTFRRADGAMYMDKAEYYKTHDRRRG